MTNCQQALISPVTATIFEELGFLTPMSEVSESQHAAGLDGSASVDFTGDATGRLVVRLYGGVLPALAANMLGEWESPPETMQRDALGELTNVLCGNLLRTVRGSRAVFHLDPPRIPAAGVLELPMVACRATMGLDAGRVEVELWTDAAAGVGASE